MSGLKPEETSQTWVIDRNVHLVFFQGDPQGGRLITSAGPLILSSEWWQGLLFPNGARGVEIGDDWPAGRRRDDLETLPATTSSRVERSGRSSHHRTKVYRMAKLGGVAAKAAGTGIFSIAEKFFKRSLRVVRELPGEPKRIINRFAKGAEHDLSAAERKRFFDLATQARDNGISGMSKKEAKKFATATGGINMRTGETAFGRSSNPVGCAEDDVVRQLGGNPDDILFSEARRPRTGEAIDICRRCQTKFRRSQFAPGADFQPAWR